MKKNAFTLVEVLGVIILLGLVAAITVPIVKTTLDESKKKVFNKQINTIIESSKNWSIKNTDALSDKTNGAILVKIDTLKSSGLLENKKIINPVDKQEINGCVEIKYSNAFNQYEYNYIEDCSFSSDMITSENSCIHNQELCDSGTEVTIQVNNSTSYPFYVIKDTGSELVLILDRNLGSNVAWMSQEDYIAAGGTLEDYGTYGNNDKGPLSALNELETVTSEWENILPYTYTLNDDGGGNEYSPITKTNVRARMLTYTEALELFELNDSMLPNFLKENLSDSTPSEFSAYWLSTADAGYNTVRSVVYMGTLTSFNPILNNRIGIRPVIELVKPVIY